MLFQESIRQIDQAWKYPIGIVIFLLGYFLGQIPLILVLQNQIEGDPTLGTEDLEQFTSNPDFDIFGINPNFGFFLMVLMFLFALIALLIFVHKGHQQKIISLINPKGIVQWKKIFFGFIVWIILGSLLEAFSYFQNPEAYTFYFNLKEFLPLLLLALFILPIQTTTEEIAFRGYLMQGVGAVSMYKWVPLIVTSVMFGAIHMFNPEIGKYGFFVMQAYYVSAGLVLGIMTIMDDSLELAIGVHAATNFFAAVVLTYSGSAIQTDALFVSNALNPYVVLLFFIIQGILFLAICQNWYKWPSFKKIFEVIQIKKHV